MNCIFCHQPGHQIGDTAVFRCSQCPFRLHFKQGCYWFYTSMEIGDCEYAAEWYTARDPDKIVELIVFKRSLPLSIQWMQILKLTEGADKITPYNIKTKLPTLLTFL